MRLLRSTCNTVEAFNTAWGTRLSSLDELAKLTSLPMNTPAARAASSQFLSQYARIYFKTCHDAIRAVDRNHLILGCRFATAAPLEVVRETDGFVDVASLNSYSLQAPVDRLARLHRLTKRPVMLTAFSFYAKDSGLPNAGPGRTLPRQQDRADRYERHVTELVRWPFVVGFHWFGYLDFPAEGVLNGESHNCGLVNVRDEPWTVLVERMSQVNPGIEEAHARPGKELLIPVEARAFGGHHYWVVPEATTWPEAKAACEDMNGHLAVIRSDSLNQFLRKLAGRIWLWIGCSLDQPSGKWTWVDGSTLSYANWSVRERQPSGGLDEIFMSMSPNGKWHDHDSEDKLGYICEWDY
ncbi:MAG: C-type lectin domain-containing protein [Phycisphaerae bacterium]|nr:C-type lectin domain-containing protein [Phycisphaerae bacterium]